MKTTSYNLTKPRKGFSLIEVIIALGIVALLLTGFLGVFGTAQKNIQRSLSVKEANQLKDSLETEMAALRKDEKSYSAKKFKSHFEKAFDMVKNGNDPSKAVIVYQYKAQTTDTDNDGILPPYTDVNNIPGAGYITQVAVRRVGPQDAFITNELDSKAVYGSVYAVRLTQLVSDPTSSSLRLGIPGEIQHVVGNSLKNATDSDVFNSAIIIYQAEFFKLPTNSYSYVTGGKWDFQKLGNPVATINMAARR